MESLDKERINYDFMLQSLGAVSIKQRKNN